MIEIDSSRRSQYMKILFVIPSLLLLLFTACHQPSPPMLSREYDTIMAREFPADGPGAVVLVAEKGQVIYRKAFGLANVELAVPMKPENLFRIGSITKQFTACAIMKLAEEGKLSLQDKLGKYIPDLPPSYQAIPIENLLTHTSGIKNYTDLPEWTGEFQKRDFKPAELIGWFSRQPLEFSPGEKFSYSNSGYFILGYLIEKVSGKPYGTYLEDRFFKPLGLQHTMPDNTSAIITGRAAGYQVNDSLLQNADFLSMTQPYAAGELLSDVDDLYQWYKDVMDGKVISMESMSKAMTAYKLKNGLPVGYGYGWFLRNIQGSPTIEHSGGINGFLTCTIYLPREDVFIALLTNSTAARPDRIASVMAALAIHKPYEYRKFSLPYDSLPAYTGVYNSLYNGQMLVTLKDSSIYAMVRGSDRNRYIPYDHDKFYMEGGFGTLTFSRDANGKVDSVVSADRNTPVAWGKTDLPMPVRKTVILPEKLLEKYLGQYKINDKLAIRITLEKGQLFAAGSGQKKFAIYSDSEHSFYAKDIDILMEFVRVEHTGDMVMLLHQDGKVYQGNRLPL